MTTREKGYGEREDLMEFVNLITLRFDFFFFFFDCIDRWNFFNFRFFLRVFCDL